MAIGTWFGTEFDDPVPSRELPAVFASGGEPEVLVADQMARGVAIVGRVQGASGAVVLKLRTGGRPVRVRVDLHVDGASQAAWSRVATPARGMRELPRLVVLRAQGTERAAAVISRQRGRLRMMEAHAWVEFDLRADEVGPDGLLIVELADAALPEWAASSLSSLAAVGVRINRVEIAAIEDGDEAKVPVRLAGPAAQLAGLVSAGDWWARGAAARVRPGPGSSWSTPAPPRSGADCGSRPRRRRRPRYANPARPGCVASRARTC
ncbi:hypothetical protein [Micromonospora tarapacensis]|uniref:hypothetical protein n=1 Tax=Micromonospora tarapacensis TaxID=2835305 RepID=UPI001E4ED292|nr:hypothetical protein [Micromonospora tarapacensis]